MNTRLVYKALSLLTVLPLLLATGVVPVIAQSNFWLEVHHQANLVYGRGADPAFQLTMTVTDALGEIQTNISIGRIPAPWDAFLPVWDFSQTSFDFPVFSCPS